MNDEDQIDETGLAKARWPRIRAAIRDALENSDHDDYTALSQRLELELGLRSIFKFTEPDYEPIPPEDFIAMVAEYARKQEHMICFVVPRLERALAASPTRWLAYVKATGRDCFDPTELTVCIAIAKRACEPLSSEHVAINALLHWCWDCILGQRPIPLVRQAPQRGHPTLILEIIRGIEQIELNWKALGLTPVINDLLAVRWDEQERWTAFIKLITKSGEISPYASLRLRGDGIWRIVRPRM